MAPSSGGSSLLSVYLGWCYALALRTLESAQESAEKLQEKLKRKTPKERRKAKEKGKGDFNAFNGSGPTYAGSSAPPDDTKRDDLRVRPPLRDYGFLSRLVRATTGFPDRRAVA